MGIYSRLAAERHDMNPQELVDTIQRTKSRIANLQAKRARLVYQPRYALQYHQAVRVIDREIQKLQMWLMLNGGKK